MRKLHYSLLTTLLILLVLPMSILLVQQVQRQHSVTSSPRYTIYEDALASGWQAQAWAGRLDLANPSPVYSGSSSIAFTPTRKGALLYLSTNTALDTTLYSFLHFAAQASRTGQHDTVTLYDATNHALSTVRLARYGGDPVPGTWKVYTIPLSDLGATATAIKGVAFESRAQRQGTVYLDSLSLTALVSSPTPDPTLTPTSTPTPDPTLTPTPSPTPDPTLTPTPSPTPGGTSSIKTVFVIAMENHNWSSIQGSSSAPYINT